jgi:hypothetical protein
MKKLLLFIAFAGLMLSSFAQTDLFFSEYIEGSENNKALEIYNPTTETIDLSNYIVVRFSNGEGYPSDLDPKSTAGGYVILEGTLEPGKCHVLVNGQTESTSTSPACDPELQALATQLDADYPAPTYMNGNDAIGLLKLVEGNYYPIDIFGQFGLGNTMYNSYGWAPVKDSAVSYSWGEEEVTATISNYVVPMTGDGTSTTGPYWMAWSKDHTLIRKSTVNQGVTSNPSGFNIAAEWDTLPAVYNATDSTWSYQDIWTNLGTHTIEGGNAIHQTSIKAFTVFPNPVTNNTFTINSSDANIARIEVYNMIGQELNITTNIAMNAALVQLNQNAKGIIIAKITFTDNTISSKKITVK